MVEGESGIMACSAPWNKPKYTPSKRLLEWPNGAIAFTYSAEEPERLRGPQHDAGWCDEKCAWKYLRDTWDMYLFGLRLGDDPRTIVTTTPKPTKVLKEIMEDEGTHVTRGSTYDNLDNLAPTFAKTVVAKYEGTRLGQQELHAVVLDDNPDALWSYDMIEDHRIPLSKCPDLIRIGVAIDPAVTANKNSDETGIVIGGVAYFGDVLHAFILEDCSLKAKPKKWAMVAETEYKAYSADRVIAEVNNGGDLVEANLRSINAEISYESVRASRGKAVRAEPVSSLYEQGRVHHVGVFGTLEDQMTNFNPLDPSAEGSPDRMDALVWLITWLFGLDKEDKSPSGIRMLGVSDEDKDNE
jgi:phage terminase large subunit-like protein